MAYLMGMNTKELHKLCGRLKEDRFLAVYVADLFLELPQYWLTYRPPSVILDPRSKKASSVQ
jgi:hypothetical protein